MFFVLPNSAFPLSSRTSVFSLKIYLSWEESDRVISLIQSLSTTLFSVFSSVQSAGEKVKGDAMDLRLDIERRKKYSCFQNQNQEIDVGDSPDFSSELCEQNLSKYCNKSKYGECLENILLIGTAHNAKSNCLLFFLLEKWSEAKTLQLILLFLFF